MIDNVIAPLPGITSAITLSTVDTTLALATPTSPAEARANDAGACRLLYLNV
ncbi:hypothetical protein KDW20_16045 [Burkholderia cenocepacia]|uniref:hypothetical protein n=1 Tax=Burkholderia cenocepacia TaxID=95486 RepID=UPI001B94565A|nr:hypothetical protein [Burkholderia cenocepacia]MBR8377283.1 hypothetical protein [Burkholderia cenocepacia]